MSPNSVAAPIVTTTGGRVQGVTVDGVSAYLGIPYAAPPLGPAAFAPPSPAASWDGVRSAADYGPTAPQVSYPKPIKNILDNVIALGEEYLNVNVWTPDPGASGLPVMVWIHGGAFARGSNRLAMYAGDTFARDGVVTVGINYRLGTPGFGSVAGAPENRGLLDQIFALQWVQENIAAFGGDPSRVTVFGESAGAMSVASLISSPRAKGLFSQAIMQSGGGGTAADPDDAKLVTAQIALQAGVEPTVEALGALSMEDLLAAQTAAAAELAVKPDPTKWGASIIDQGLGIMGQFPVVDGDVLPDVPTKSIAAGAGSGIPLIAGWNADEFCFFLVPTGVAALATPDAARFMMGRSGKDVSAYEARLEAGEKAGDVLCAALTEFAFAGPTRSIAEARPDSPTYLYEFEWETPIAGIRAGHAVELPFVFDHLSDAADLVGTEPPQTLADELHSTWVRFATTGDPGWSTTDLKKFGADVPAV